MLKLENLEVQPRPGKPNMPYIFAIVDRTNPNNHLEPGCETEEEMNEWVSQITSAIQEQKSRYAQIFFYQHWVSALFSERFLAGMPPHIHFYSLFPLPPTPPNFSYPADTDSRLQSRSG